MKTKRLSREESKQQTRESLLQAAQIVFARSGFYNASIDEIAEEGGFTKGAVYANFNSKTDLFLALLDHRVGKDVPGWLEAFNTENSLEQKIDLSQQILTMSVDDIQWLMLELEFTLYAMRDPVILSKLTERNATIKAAMESTFVRHFKEGNHASKLSEDELATVFLGINTGLRIQAALDPSSVTPALWSKVLRTFLA